MKRNKLTPLGHWLGGNNSHIVSTLNTTFLWACFCVKISINNST